MAPDTGIRITEALITKESIPAAAFSAAKANAPLPSTASRKTVHFEQIFCLRQRGFSLFTQKSDASFPN
jgi:hypothetical protein